MCLTRSILGCSQDLSIAAHYQTWSITFFKQRPNMPRRLGSVAPRVANASITSTPPDWPSLPSPSMCHLLNAKGGGTSGFGWIGVDGRKCHEFLCLFVCFSKGKDGSNQKACQNLKSGPHKQVVSGLGWGRRERVVPFSHINEHHIFQITGSFIQKCYCFLHVCSW